MPGGQRAIGNRSDIRNYPRLEAIAVGFNLLAKRRTNKAHGDGFEWEHMQVVGQSIPFR
jgi:hypothetical protein